MSEWWTYRLGDLLLFAPRTYYRLFELYNQSVWPLHVLAAVVGLAILSLLLLRPRYAGRAIALLLALCWAWVAYAFLFSRYASINLAASYFALGFAVQAALLLLSAAAGRLAFSKPETAASAAGAGLFAVALVVQPVVGPPAGSRLVANRAVRSCARPDRARHARCSSCRRPAPLGALRYPAPMVCCQRADTLGHAGAGRRPAACRRRA